VGYTDFAAKAKVVAIIKDNQRAEELSDGELGSIVLDITPFYAESGGQAGDGGMLKRWSYWCGKKHQQPFLFYYSID